jgi:hypothetical protein
MGGQARFDLTPQPKHGYAAKVGAAESGDFLERRKGSQLSLGICQSSAGQSDHAARERRPKQRAPGEAVIRRQALKRFREAVSASRRKRAREAPVYALHGHNVS